MSSQARCSWSRSRFLAISLGLATLAVLAFVRADTAPQQLTSRSRPTAKSQPTLEVGQEVKTEAGHKRRFTLPDGGTLYVNERTSFKLDEARRMTLQAGEIFIEADSPLVVKTAQREISGKAAQFGVRMTADGTAVVAARGKLKLAGMDAALVAGQQLLPGSNTPTETGRVSHLLDWTRDLMADGTLVPANPNAGGTIITVDANGQAAKLSLRKYHVDVHIEDGFARTTIDQTYFNDSTQRLEGTFIFPLPADASLSRLAMYVDGKLMEGGMTERDYARNVYESVVYRQKDPALLEWVDSTTFKMRVFPLEARQEKRIVLSYTQRLASLYGQLQYRFPAGHSLGVVKEWSAHVRVKNGAAFGWSCASHALSGKPDKQDLLLDAAEKNTKLQRDLVLSLTESKELVEDTRFSSAELDGAKYLMLRYRPALSPSPLAGEGRGEGERQRRDWIIFCEASADREPLLARTQIEIIRSLLGRAEPDDNFVVVAANTRLRTMGEPGWLTPGTQLQRVTPDNIQTAISFLENTQLIGALDLGRAFTEMEPIFKAAKNPYLVHLGTGIAAMGERRDDVLAKQIPDNVRYVGIGVGRRWSRSFMKIAAERTGGYFTQINPDEPISWRAFELAATLDTPRLLNVKVADKAGNPFLTDLATIAHGQEICAVARIDGAMPDSVVLTGQLGKEKWQKTLPVKNVRPSADHLPRTWAKLEIERLLADRSGDPEKTKKRVIELSKQMYVMTPFTSLLVLENEAMYEQYKVDRGRKDHWAMYPCPATISVVYEPLPGMPASVKEQVEKPKPTPEQVLATIQTRGGTLQPQQQIVTQQFQPLNQINAPNFNNVLMGLTPARAGVSSASPLTSDLGIPITNSSFQYAIPPYGGYPGTAPGGDRQVFQFWLGFFNGGPDEGRSTRMVAPMTVGQITVTGNSRDQRDSFLRQIPMTVTKAEPMDVVVARVSRGLLNNSESNLARLNIFEEGIRPTVEVLDPDGPNPIKDILVNLNETRTGSLMFGVGVNSDAGLTGSIVLNEPRLRNNTNPREAVIYKRPSFATEDRIFFDLVSYAPGMSITTADVLAVIEAETVPDPAAAPGKIDPAAEKLIFAARGGAHWQTYEPADGFAISFSGGDSYRWERTLFGGLREQVICDGRTLWHLYPDLGIGSRREVSRFHRADFARLVPWYLPWPADLARGADLVSVDENTVAIVPHGIKSLKDHAGKPVRYARLHLVFANGLLAERQLVEMPAKKILLRQTLAADGTIRVLDADGKELAVRKGTLKPAQPLSLVPDVKKLVVLPLPYRTADFVRKSLAERKVNLDEQLGKGTVNFDNRRMEDALPLFAAEFAAGNGPAAYNLFKQQFYTRNHRQLGFYVLLAACGTNLDAENADVLSEHPNEPLAQYLALYTSPVLRKHASQWAVGVGQWNDGFLKHLAVTHSLLQRWQNARPITDAERDRAVEYVRKNAGTPFAWTLLTLMQDRAEKNAQDKEKTSGDAKTSFATLAELFGLFEKTPGLGYAARYEQAFCLWRDREGDTSRERFRKLYAETIKDGSLPVIDSRLRTALLGGKGGGWGELIRATASGLLKDNRRLPVIVLAWQCWQLDDAPLANHLLQMAMEQTPAEVIVPHLSPPLVKHIVQAINERERFRVTLAGISFLRETGQLPQADKLLAELLADPKRANSPALWRLGAELAKDRELKSRELFCLEKALEAEYFRLPEMIDVKAVRADYKRLLDHYQNQAEAMVSLNVAPPPDFLARVVRAADRWRSLDSEPGDVCQQTAKILQTLGRRELAWDYLTTPIGMKPMDAEPWSSLAWSLHRKGELDLADRAFAAAFATEPTNPQYLWDRAQSLRHAGKNPEAQKLLKQIAEGEWQPRFDSLKTQANWQIIGR